MTIESSRERLSATSRERAVAERIWAEAAQDALPTRHVEATVDLVLRGVEAGLRRWIGAEGYAALLARAVAETLPHHAALAAVADLVANPSTTPDSGRDAAADMQQAIVALLMTMMQQLGAIIGREMAVRLIELSVPPSTRGAAGTETNTTLP